ncbi:expressed unknown protein [Seminavis robusta]|uniref:Uncharacterized protein n=1 Tax=Seminavis robusta TaxID=568900 RepID=A0A9N8E5W8_9STRA|nr:expressed unknown protein [Seminavis robusta]|eukprot:Sro695_g188610.1 n/a (416) ;mRNA; f:7068-8315
MSKIGRVLLVGFPAMAVRSLSVLALQQPQPCNARRGSKHIERNDRILVEDISSAQDLQDLANLNALRKPGSLKYTSSWRDWCARSLDASRYHLSQNLPHVPDPQGFGELFFNLGAAADTGEMPSFQDPGSRSGYALEFFCRARLLAHLLFDNYNQLSLSSGPRSTSDDFIRNLYRPERSVETGRNENICRMVSIGGGPGYDFVGVLLADTFSTCGRGSTRIEGTVFDYEKGWEDLVKAMNVATNHALVNDEQSSLHWGGTCDITKPLTDASNQEALLPTIASTDVFVCQYCIAENAKGLRESEFVFFADLFDEARMDTVFILTEVTPRIWPEIVDVLLQRPDGGEDFQVHFIGTTTRKKGGQMFISKRKGSGISPEALSACEEYRRLRTLHERKIENGFQRQPKKVRGGKALVEA